MSSFLTAQHSTAQHDGLINIVLSRVAMPRIEKWYTLVELRTCNTLCVGVSNAYYIFITHGQSDLLEVGFPLSVLRALV